MKKPTPAQLLRLAIATSAIFGLSSCISTDGYYGPSGYDSGYYGPSHGSSYYGSSYSGYGSSYNHGRCSRCGYNPCRCSHTTSSNHNHSDHNDHGDDDNHREHDNQIKLIGGRQPGKPNRPDGYHPREWYKKRGYDLDEYKHKHADGDVHKGDDADNRKKKKH